jgi:hypothetical protein
MSYGCTMVPTLIWPNGTYFQASVLRIRKKILYAGLIFSCDGNPSPLRLFTDVKKAQLNLFISKL